MITSVDTSILLDVFVDADDADQSEADCVCGKNETVRGEHRNQ